MTNQVVNREDALSVGANRRQHLILPALVLGLLTGLVSVCFQVALVYGESARNQAIGLAHHYPDIGPWVVMATVLSALALSAGLVFRFAPEAAASGVPHVKMVMQGYRTFRWLRVLTVKFISTLIGGSVGFMVGRGGPMLHIGAAVGQGVSDLWPDPTVKQQSVMVAAGGGAGLAATFNAPLAGLAFAFEELGLRGAPAGLFAAAIACFSADMVCRWGLGQGPFFHITLSQAPPLNGLVAFVPLGVLAGLFGGLFNKALLAGQKLLRLPAGLRWLWWWVLAVLVAAVAWWLPDLLGGGQHFINSLFAGKALEVDTLAVFFVIRFVVTVGSSCSGAAAGIFMPSLALGALLGLAVGGIVQTLFPGLGIAPAAFAAAGMAAFFTGAIKRPLTAMMLVMEMTGSYRLVLPLFVACFSAHIMADWLRIVPIYEALMQQALRQGSGAISRHDRF
ncbi:MAG: H(+)/Cl(-) exchange transporter ClcA [Methylovulum sp.]|nr:H(+)/Cl(-) exchange transporter ClcA [Methylovulum sp.]